MLGGEVVTHGFSDPSAGGWESSFEILPSEIPGSGSFRAEYSSVLDGELRPVVVVSMGIEGVPRGASPAPMVVFEWVELVVSDESLPVGEVFLGRGVQV